MKLLFLNELRSRLVACRWQEWDSHVNNSDRFSIYRTFSTISRVKMYLQINLDQHLRYVMTRFRLGISDIAQHHYRYKNHSEMDLICPLCGNGKEDELHFLLICTAFSNLRTKYIPLKFFRNPNWFKLSLLLASEKETIIKNVSIFLYKASHLRSVMTS